MWLGEFYTSLYDDSHGTGNQIEIVYAFWSHTLAAEYTRHRVSTALVICLWYYLLYSMYTFFFFFLFFFAYIKTFIGLCLWARYSHGLIRRVFIRLIFVIWGFVEGWEETRTTSHTFPQASLCWVNLRILLTNELLKYSSDFNEARSCYHTYSLDGGKSRLRVREIILEFCHRLLYQTINSAEKLIFQTLAPTLTKHCLLRVFPE